MRSLVALRLLEAVFLRTSLTSRLLLRVLLVDLPARERVPLVVLVVFQERPLDLGVVAIVLEPDLGVGLALVTLLLTFTVL